MEGYYTHKKNILDGVEKFSSAEMAISSVTECEFSSVSAQSRFFYHGKHYTKNISSNGINNTYDSILPREKYGYILEGYTCSKKAISAIEREGKKQIGLLLATISDGTWYIYTKDGITWLSQSLSDTTNGIKLPHNPNKLTVEMQGGGGGGAASGSFHASSGGAGGGYKICHFELSENGNYYKIIVGKGGNGGRASASGNNGNNGGDTILYWGTTSGSREVAAALGGDGGINDDGYSYGGEYRPKDSNIGFSGGGGGYKEKAGDSLIVRKFKPGCKYPENEKSWTRGGFNGGTSGGNNFGGGGGASLFANGGNADDRDNPKAGTLGSGGAGGGYRVGGRNGARGGDGFVNIYY